MVVAGVALFALCAVQAGKANSTLEKETRELRAEKRDLAETVRAYGLTGERRRAQVFETMTGCRVSLLFNHGGTTRHVFVREFPFGDDRGFARRQAEELRDKINEE